jgi:hypothetical protein
MSDAGHTLARRSRAGERPRPTVLATVALGAKLGLAPSDSDDRRVIAAIKFFES